MLFHLLLLFVSLSFIRSVVHFIHFVSFTSVSDNIFTLDFFDLFAIFFFLASKNKEARMVIVSC